MQTIPVANLALVLIPALLVVGILWRWSAGASTSIYALGRMVIQLCLIGFVLTFIFQTENSLLVLSVLAIMLTVSSWIALRTVTSKRGSLYFRALTATFIVNGCLLVLITQSVLRVEPWFSPSIVIPLAGMTFAVGMNAISLFTERYYSELEQHNDATARNAAYQATLIPTINSLLAVGLVSLPGMMTGQILSGVSPLIAVRYQIMIMLMLFASSGLTSALFYQLIRKQQQPPP